MHKMVYLHTTMKRAWNYVVTMWQPAGLFLAGVLIIIGLFTFHLGSLVPGAAPAEISARTASQNLHDSPSSDPINAPYKVFRYIAYKIHSSIAFERLVSGGIAGVAIVLFFLIMRRFCSRYAAGLATVMFATSSSLLSSGRLATPNILMLMLLGLLACGYHLRFQRNRRYSWILTTIVLALSLYVPGMIYFAIAGILWQFRAVRRDQSSAEPAIIIICGIIFALIMLPLVYGLLKNPGLFREYLGIPAKLPSIVGFLKNCAAVPLGIFVKAPLNPLYRLGKQPTLDVFATCMFILGCYSLKKHYRLDRLILLVAVFVGATLYTAISNNYENSLILLPFIYFCIALGIGMFIEQWRRTFPFNPLARGLAYGAIALAVAVSVNFQAWRYFVAWPHNQATKQTFTLK